jgi:hypothetical protein
LQVLKIIEENGYYLYGMKHEAYNTVPGYQYRQGVLQFFGTSEGYVTDTRTLKPDGTKKRQL